MPLSIKQIVKILGINEKELERRALRTLLVDKLRKVRAEKTSIPIKYEKQE